MQPIQKASETKTDSFHSSLDNNTVLVDLERGNSCSVLDFFLMSDGGILVVTPEPTSIENTYRFLKSAFYRRLKQSVSSSSVKDLIDGAMDRKNEMEFKNPYDLIKAGGGWTRGMPKGCSKKPRPSIQI